ncbi:GreA/GreB family elongation factor [Metabacillus halosaccharovorans]|uniref:GreA/GreB family elongation factor n=1 Tax=Metabacillus halosaccharovorans TaxID=930124 RepID=UPI001C1F4D29|nr:GreA/GreB family elongation factor [Metabacillus halosaccharovorans]MBU7594833.1 GreA/GreB family elongation factor [Metabacillus halosaccharovorans]
MNHNIPQHREHLVQQMVYIDENIKELTNLYNASTPVQEQLKNFFHLYLLELEELLSADQKSNLISSLPKVYIGTRVTVLFDDENDTEDFIICFPEESDPDSGCISFLSPVGRQLLLKKIGEKVMLKVPTGELPVVIKEITYVGHLFDEQQNMKEA